MIDILVDGKVVAQLAGTIEKRTENGFYTNSGDFICLNEGTTVRER
jgi:hypothetical protein